MSIRAFAAHLGVAVASVTNWERRGTLIRLRHETQEILDRDLAQISDDVRARFEAILDDVSGAPSSALDGAQRLRQTLSHPSRVDTATVQYLRAQVDELDAAYNRVPAASLIAAAMDRYGQIRILQTHTSSGPVRSMLQKAFAESAILMGQLVWDASLRRDNYLALHYFTQAASAAEDCGDNITTARAQLRSSLVALYGQKDPVTGLQMATRAAITSRAVSNAFTALALLHAAEAHARLGHATACEHALGSSEKHLERAGAADVAANLINTSDLSRMAGSCYLTLGDAARATDLLEATLKDATLTKAAAVAAANRALALARQAKVDEAVEGLHQAIDIVDATGGGGGLTVAFAAGRELSPWRAEPGVQEVQDRLFELMIG